MIRYILVIWCGLSMFKLIAQDDIQIKSQIDSFSYSYGMMKAGSLSMDYVDEIDLDLFIEGFKDAYLKNKTKINPAEAAMLIRLTQGETQIARIEAIKKQGEEYLEKNAKKEGVITLKSGVQYRILGNGEGRKPKANDRIHINQLVMQPDGKVLLSQNDRKKPKPFHVTELIPGLQEVILMMREGDWWEVSIPWQQAYGDKEGLNGVIPAYSTLVNELRLVKID